jgi:phosphopantetheinyl transferase
MAHVLVLHARLDNSVPGTGFSGAERLATLLERLPYAKRLEIEGRDPAGRQASLAGIWLVLEGAALSGGRAVEAGALRFPVDGKPHCIGGPCFSISHGATHVAVAVSEDVEIGFDLEELGPESPGGGDPRPRLERWTATESVLKAAGLGLREARKVELDLSLATGRVAGMNFQLTPLAIAPDVVAYLAAPEPIQAVTVRTIELPGSSA